MCKFTNHLFTASVVLLVSGIDFHDWLARAAPPSPSLHNSFYEDLFDDLAAESMIDLSGGLDVEPMVNMIAELNDYDRHYDQRQEGSGNFRLKLDGFVIALPQTEAGRLAEIPSRFISPAVHEWMAYKLEKSHLLRKEEDKEADKDHDKAEEDNDEDKSDEEKIDEEDEMNEEKQGDEVRKKKLN